MMAFTAHDGRVFLRGVYHTPDSCERLLTIFRRQAEAGDWFAPMAKTLAEELAAAMDEADDADWRAV